jgi:hypothetical protein
MFIVKKAVRDYAKARKRRVSRAFLSLLDKKVLDTIEYHIHMNGKITLKP